MTVGVDEEHFYFVKVMKLKVQQLKKKLNYEKECFLLERYDNA